MEKFLVIGWREWLSLPELGIGKIKAKIDTGARTSAIHAFNIETFQKKGKQRVRFHVHPSQTSAWVKKCESIVVDYRWVSDSGGHREHRYVIKTLLKLSHYERQIELTLTDRSTMRFRFLLGRTGMSKQFLINPRGSFLADKLTK